MEHINKRYWDETYGWGDIVMETESYIVVKFDSDPWLYMQLPQNHPDLQAYKQLS